MSTQITPKEIERLSRKDREYWDTIRRREIFREFRFSMCNLGIPLPIPLNNVWFTHEYCKKFGNKSVEPIQENPLP